jgi:hypothetical protein
MGRCAGRHVLLNPCPATAQGLLGAATQAKDLTYRIDRPVLVLMGDKDTETPPDECVAKLQAAGR